MERNSNQANPLLGIHVSITDGQHILPKAKFFRRGKGRIWVDLENILLMEK